jgi:hypothetical protein
MVFYRIFKFSPDNHIVGIPEEVEFDTDRDVIEYAETKLDGLDLEVWNRSRLVIRLKSADESSTSGPL